MAAPVHITDHAVLRWLEHSAGIDVERIREALASNAAQVAVEIHCGTVILPDGCRLRIVGNSAVTVLPRKPKRKLRECFKGDDK